MAGVGDIVRRLDYQKRARNTLGIKRASTSTKIQECSAFVRSANEHQVDKLQSAVRKMEADEKLFRDVHSKQLSTVKKFHNTVHIKSTNFKEINFTGASAPISDSSNGEMERKPDDIFSRRASLNFPAAFSKSSSNQKRRHSVQPDTRKYGRSFRKLKDAVTPGPKSKVYPEPVVHSSVL